MIEYHSSTVPMYPREFRRVPMVGTRVRIKSVASRRKHWLNKVNPILVISLREIFSPHSLNLHIQKSDSVL